MILSKIPEYEQQIVQLKHEISGVQDKFRQSKLQRHKQHTDLQMVLGQQRGRISDHRHTAEQHHLNSHINSHDTSDLSEFLEALNTRLVAEQSQIEQL